MMKSINLLEMIFTGKVSIEKAEEIVDQILESQDAANIATIIGVSQVEWTAYAHGASLDEIAQWRATGWPNVCIRCGKPISIENYGWLATDVDGIGKTQLKHATCPVTEN